MFLPEKIMEESMLEEFEFAKLSSVISATCGYFIVNSKD